MKSSKEKMLSSEKRKIYLTYGEISDGRKVAICSAGHLKAGDDTVLVLSVQVVQSEEEAKEWFEKVCKEELWKTDEFYA